MRNEKQLGQQSPLPYNQRVIETGTFGWTCRCGQLKNNFESTLTLVKYSRVKNKNFEVHLLQALL
jgi:hypothetical protein